MAVFLPFRHRRSLHQGFGPTSDRGTPAWTTESIIRVRPGLRIGMCYGFDLPNSAAEEFGTV
jgi:hypothetical protein